MNRVKHHVKKGDNVEVISGNFRGSSGKILQVIARKDFVLIEGVLFAGSWDTLRKYYARTDALLGAKPAGEQELSVQRG